MNFRVFFSILFCFAIVIFACAYLYFKDRYDKESKKLLLLLFVSGSITGIAAFFLESFLGTAFLNAVFKNQILPTADGMMAFTSTTAKALYYFSKNVIVSSLLVILIKVLVLVLFTRKNKNFNSLFDGTIYSCYIFISAALFESICFAITNGWDLFMGYFFLKTCIQLFAAILLGYYYTMWYLSGLAYEAETDLAEQGLIHIKKSIKPCVSLAKGIGFSVIICGIFGFVNDFALIHKSPLSTCIILVSLFLSMRTVSILSKQDTADELIASRLLLRKYKELSDKKDLIISTINKYTN